MAPSSASPSDLVCILDVAELDLYTSDLSLNFNSPQGMCPYTVVSPYTFYEDMPGNVSRGGAITIAYNTTQNAITLNTTVVTSSDACGPGSPNGAGINRCGLAIGGNISQAVSLGLTNTPVCLYDYSQDVTAPGPNCCVGQYVTQAFETTTGVTTTAGGSFGGHPGNCLAGPASTSQQKDANSNPLNTIMTTFVSGTNTVYKIDAPIKRVAPTVLSVANYWEPRDVTQSAVPVAPAVGNLAFPPNDGVNWCDGLGVVTGFVPDHNGCGSVSAIPVPMNNNVQLINGSTIQNVNVRTRTGGAAPTFSAGAFANVVYPGMFQTHAQPYYEFQCLDSAGDYLARIRVLIRSWDTVAGFTAATNPYNVAAGVYTDSFGGLWHGQTIWRDVTNAWWQFANFGAGSGGVPTGTIPGNILGGAYGSGFSKNPAGAFANYIGPAAQPYAGNMKEPFVAPTNYPHFGNF
ncbi:MAG: hypothetical protein HY075_08200 [Deltaproteobacteria bacterium]|nr:hypothetical protein [Deltaproteobacteria bacterium]